MSALLDAYGEHFRSGGGFASIVEARKFAEASLGHPVLPGSTEAKQIEEALEAALVRVAQEIVRGGSPPQETFPRLVDLHERQPALNVRSSTSVSQQAYSTPLPIAYLASVLAQVSPDKSIYEPTAGHGALLMGCDVHRATVNELNPERARDLREQGYHVTQQDAASYQPKKLHDIVIMNPPFGTVEADGQQRRFPFGDFHTNQIDHAIALKSLGAMKPDGRAVLILGGKLGADEDKRSDRYNSRESRGFYWTLYQDYNVTDHLSIHGNLYRKQGAGFPIDLIVVAGRGKSARPLPAVEVPHLYKSFAELEGYLDDVLRTEPQRVGTMGRPPDIRGAGTPGRDGDSHHGTLPGTAMSSAGMADGRVDGVRVSLLPGGNPGDATQAHGGGVPIPAPSIAAGGADPHGDTGVAGGVGAVPGAGERPAAFSPADAADGVSSHGGNQSPGAGGIVGDVPHPGRAADPGGMAAGEHRTDAAIAAAAPQQVAYHPKSRGSSLGTLVPANMQAGTTQALSRLQREVGSLDAYVTERLAYSSPQELHQHFSAEQVDAIALSIANLEQGSGFILGDQTGIGKGRVVAAMIRYACISGRTPIFVTKDPPLYADMVRDLRDIGMPGFRPLVTNSGLKHLPLPDGRTLHTTAKRHNAMLRTIQQAGHLQEHDAIFTTYTQMQTVKGKEPERRNFLRAFAANSILILDESHEAGGSIGGGAEQGFGNRADFVRELVGQAQGVVYSSATYAKDPAVMDLYARTDMGKALSNMEKLSELVATGGVPLQQTLAAMLTEAGQYVRRERSFAGVSFEPATVAVNHDTAQKVSRIMADIMEFDRLKQQAVKGIDKLLKAEAKEVHGDNATGGAGASSTNFTSIMHNVIDQMLFALKAEETVQRCLQLLQQEEPEKPVLALSNTMGSLIASQADLQDLAPGDPLDVDFGAVLQRYLERSRDIIVGNPWGEKSRQRLSDAELGDMAAAKYHGIAERIAATDFDGLPISPIDYITHRLHQAGYRVGEVTGREHIAVYGDDGSTLYQRRANRERTKEAAVLTVKAFNDGDLDVIILNRSGSTGISLHASEHFADQRQRHMMVVQAEADINQFMQMLGRVHRTGQVVPPNFTLLMADLPAEKRPGAVLAKKMASLNANTTAARSSGFGLGDIPDFMNEYGDRVVADLMKADPALHAALDCPLDSREGMITDGAIRRVTGRIPLLPIQEQEEVYNRIEQQYRAYVASQEALGESVLEASTLNLDAITMARMEIVPADFDSQSPFTGAVYAEICDTKAPRKPYTSQQVAEKLCRVLSLSADCSPDADCSSDIVSAIQNAGQEQASTTQETLEEAARRYKLQVPPERSTAIDNGVSHIGSILAHFPVGQPICLHSGKEQEFYGVVGSVERTGLSSNPAASSSWEMRLLLADAMRELRLPLSQVNTGRDNAVRLEVAEASPQGVLVYQMFDDCQQRTRETRQILTGNLLRAWEKFPGTIVNFTDAHGNIRQGLLTRRGFDVEQALEHLGVSMPTPQDAKTFLHAYHGQLQTSDQRLTITAGEPGTFVLQTPKAKDTGGRYYLDEALLAAAEAEFFSVGERMECTVAGENLEAVLQVLMEGRGYTLATYNQQQQAREMLGTALPQFVPVEQSPPPPTPVSLEPQETPWEEVHPNHANMPAGEDGQVQTAVIAASEHPPAPLPLLEQEGDVPAATTDREEDSSTAETGISPSPTLPSAIAPRKAQSGITAQNIAQLLEQGGLLEAVMAGEDFHRKTENEPYIPLVIERHGDQLTLTHYLSQNGDSYIDSEMVFAIAADGRLSLTETAVAALGGELRYLDQKFAALFSENLLHQGFGEAISRSHSQDVSPTAQIEPTAADQKEVQARRKEDVECSSSQPVTIPSSPAIPDEHRHQPVTHSPPSSLPAPYPTAPEVSLWAMAARDLGLPEPARRSVQILYEKVSDGEQPAMPPKVWKTMARDVEQYQPYRDRGQQLLDAAQWILAQVGTENAKQERVFKGNTYEITATNKTFTVEKHTQGRTDVILQAHDNRIVRTTVTPQDVVMFAAFMQHLQGERSGR